ncbi:MAG: lysophospholipid acyltransferase family protein [Thermoanaerobaculia bacterium]
MRTARQILIWTGVVVLTVTFGVPSILAAFIPPRGDWFLLFARGWARSILRIAGISVRVLHSGRLDPARSYVVVSNHESFCDIPVLLATLPMSLRFMAKRSIFGVPVLGWSIAAAGFIPVDRGERSRGAATMDAALRRLRGGRSVVIFPEETRSANGSLLPFKQGAALLALRSGLPLLPFGIAGTRRILPKGSWRISGGPVVLCAGSPLGVEGRRPSDRRDLTRRLQAEVESLREEAARELPAGARR